MTDSRGQHAGAPHDTTEAELQTDIERTREDLADTVDQLAAKLDVGTRLRDSMTRAVDATKETTGRRVDRLRARVTRPDGRPDPTALAVGGGLVAAIAAVITVRLWLRPSSPKRRRHRPPRSRHHRSRRR